MTKKEITSLIYIGFCIPSHYKQSVWRKAKRIMLELCEMGIGVYHNPIRGRGHFWTRGKAEKMTIDQIADYYCQQKGVEV